METKQTHARTSTHSNTAKLVLIFRLRIVGDREYELCKFNHRKAEVEFCVGIFELLDFYGQIVQTSKRQINIEAGVGKVCMLFCPLADCVESTKAGEAVADTRNVVEVLPFFEPMFLVG